MKITKIFLFSLIYVIFLNKSCEALQEIQINCKEQKDRWYYEEYLWVHQKTTKSTRLACCHDCFLSSINCKSWMFNENSGDCYHSSHEFINSANVKFDGMYAGSVSI
jgi:hypothetical protein